MDADEIINNEADKVTVDALAASYRTMHRFLAGEMVEPETLSRVSDMLALALRAHGTSGADALAGLVG